MKIQVRYNVFETNSSSMHSIVLSKNIEKFTEDDIRRSFRFFIGSKGEGVVDFSQDDVWKDTHCLDFGRAPFDILHTYADKLRYVIACYNYQEDMVKQILDEVKEKHNFIKDFKFKTKKRYYDDEDDLDENYYGYTDDGPGIIMSFLSKHSITLEEFLTRRDIIVIVDGDEYGASLHMQKANILSLTDDSKVEDLSYVD